MPSFMVSRTTFALWKLEVLAWAKFTKFIMNNNKIIKSQASMPDTFYNAAVALQILQHSDLSVLVWAASGRCVVLAEQITCFSVKQSGRLVVSGDCKGGLKLWSLVEGLQLDARPDAHPEGCSALAFLEPHVVSLLQACSATILSCLGSIFAVT